MARFQSLGSQFGDNALDPLVGGTIYFYESGTTTFKDTFADVNLSILNTNPVILSGAGRLPNVFFGGVAKGILTDQDEVQIEVRDFLEGIGSGTTFQQWSQDITYNIPDVVQVISGDLYQSKTNGNLGNEPTASPDDWKQILGVNPLSPYSETLQTVSGTDIDLSTATKFDLTLTANTTLTFSNALTNSNSFTLKVIGGDTWALTYPASVTRWRDGEEPTLAAESWIVFETSDGGATFTGFYIGEVAAP